MEKFNEIGTKLENCVETLEDVFLADTNGKVSQAVTVVEMAKAYIENAFDRDVDKIIIERDLTDCLCAIISVMNTLENAISSEIEKVGNVVTCLREFI